MAGPANSAATASKIDISRWVMGLLASSAFRLAALSAAAFVLLVSALVAIVFWQANAVLTDQVVATLSAEADALRTEARSGRAGLLDAVAAARGRKVRVSMCWPIVTDGSSPETLAASLLRC